MPQLSNLVFCGTPRFAVPTLEALVDSGFQVDLVITQPDRPKGRGLETVFCPVKRCALDLALPIAQPEKIKANEELRKHLGELKPDAIVVVGYGRIIPQWMLDLPSLGNINLHASLLPKYRGAAPIQWAIANGETATGVTTMRIDAGLDTGDILLQREVSIAEEDTAETLAPTLAKIGAELVVQTLEGLRTGQICPLPQDSSHASFAPILKREDGLVGYSRSASEIFNRIRGFQPWPGAYTKFRGKTLQILKGRPVIPKRTLEPAELAVEDDRLLVGCAGNTALDLLEMQLEGKKRTSARDFIHGYRPRPGERLG